MIPTHALKSLLAIAIAVDGFTTDELVSWIVRGALGLGVAAIAYVLRNAAATIKETSKVQNRHSEILAAHSIMFDHWLETLSQADVAANRGRRDSDKLLRALIEARRDDPEP